MAVTLGMVAERAGVSRSAVSRAFTPGASVAPATRARVMQAAEALGYSPNLLARSLTTRQTGMVGLVLNNFHNPVFLQIFDLFTRGLQDRGLRPLLVNLSGETDPARSVRLLRQYSADGVIVASSELPNTFAESFKAAGIPTVLAFGRGGASPRVDVVSIDNVEAGRMAARALLARGYKDAGFIGGPEGATTTQDRRAGFAELAGGRARFAGDYTYEAGHRAMQAELAAGRPAQAYFCADDVLSMGALAALAEAGLTVPRDVGIIGLNDMEMAGWAQARLTTIRQPFAEMVAAALDRLGALMADPALPPAVRLLPCELVVRGTLRG
ncbi:MAG: LacI family DNA-binding transcriptional regulator [Paracoccaceae bacterium]